MRFAIRDAKARLILMRPPFWRTLGFWWGTPHRGDLPNLSGSHAFGRALGLRQIQPTNALSGGKRCTVGAPALIWPKHLHAAHQPGSPLAELKHAAIVNSLRACQLFSG